MITYTSVKEALRSGVIITPTPTKTKEEEEVVRTKHYLHRRHTVDTPHSQTNNFAISSTTIRLNPDNAPAETLDVSQYTQEDLKRLKEEDPFFYFSIPEIHLRSYRMGYPGVVDEEEEGYDESVDDSEESSQDDDSNMEFRSCKYETQHGNVVSKNTNPSPRENFSRSFSTKATQQQQRTKGRRATLPPNFLEQSAAVVPTAGGVHHHSLQVPIHKGPVTKSRRLSVEAHPDLVVENMFDDDDFSWNELSDDSDMEEDLLLRILGAKCFLQERTEEENEDECT